MMYINNQEFEWDLNKAAINRIKHGIDFTVVTLAFFDPSSLVTDDHSHSIIEHRQKLIGSIDPGIVVVIFTMRKQNVVRIISARFADRVERRLYEQARSR